MEIPVEKYNVGKKRETIRGREGRFQERLAYQLGYLRAISLFRECLALFHQDENATFQSIFYKKTISSLHN